MNSIEAIYACLKDNGLYSNQLITNKNPQSWLLTDTNPMKIPQDGP